MSAARGASAQPAASRPRRSRRVVPPAVLSATLAVAGVTAWQWWTHPTAFDDPGDSVRVAPVPVSDAALSTTVVLPKVSGSSEEIVVDHMDATFSTNTAGAVASFWVCHMAPGEDPIGAVHDPGAVCRDIEPFEPQLRLDHGVAPDSDYLFVTITPTRRGVAHLETVDIEYRRSGDHFHQRGTQTVRADRKVTAL